MSHYERARFQRRMGLCWPCQKVVKFQDAVTFEMPAPSLVTLVIGRCPHCYATMHSRANPTEYCDVCDLEVIDVGPWPFGCQCNRPPDQTPRPPSGPKPASFWRRH